MTCPPPHHPSDASAVNSLERRGGHKIETLDGALEVCFGGVNITCVCRTYTSMGLCTSAKKSFERDLFHYQTKSAKSHPVISGNFVL